MSNNKTLYVVLVLSLLMLITVLTGCFRSGSSTSTQPANLFRSEKYYLTVTLPEGWAGVEGPESLVSSGHIEGEIAFNSWGEAGYWSHQVWVGDSENKAGNYGWNTILNQLPEGGVYVVLTQPRMGYPNLSQHPDEYTSSDLSGLLQSKDWRKLTYKEIDFYKWGRFFKLGIYCRSEISNFTNDQLNRLLASWRFDAIPAGDILWLHLQAIKLLPEQVQPLEFPINPDSGNSRSGPRVTKVEVRDTMIHFRYEYYWDTSSSYSDWLSDKYHWWEIDVTQDGKTVLKNEGGLALPEND